MIIFEGVDKAGKTTLINELSRHFFDMPIRKFVIPEGDPTYDYIEEMRRIRAPRLYDRFLFGELPYSTVKRPHARYVYNFELTMMELMLNTLPHLVVYCKPGWDVVASRFLAEGDSYIKNLTELRQLYEIYKAMFRNSACNVIEYPHNSVPTILEIARRSVIDDAPWRQYLHWKDYGMPGIGSINAPQYMFIGERYNHNAKHQVTFWSKSGQYLLNCIGRAGIKLTDCHFTNAISEDIRQITLEQIRMVAPKKIICLGDVAWSAVQPYKDILEDDGYVVTKIFHPSYWSRFRSRDEAGYIEGVKLACGL